MARKKQLIIPVFIPFGGCPNQCVFCDQEGITGGGSLPEIKDITVTIDTYLSTWHGRGRKEAAFYGGSFTALPEETQLNYLRCAYQYVEKGLLDALRISTRPDCISKDVIDYLKAYRVEVVELGVQSMSDTVLKLSGRGHGSKETVQAARLVKNSGIRLGLQFMPGLPGDTVETILKTTEGIIKLSPDFVRIYPTLVLKNTPLHKMYLSGVYRPWGLDEMASICRGILKLFKEADIPVIRVGLQPTDDLVKNLVSGPYHPSFRQLVESERD